MLEIFANNVCGSSAMSCAKWCAEKLRVDSLAREKCFLFSSSHQFEVSQGENLLPILKMTPRVLPRVYIGGVPR